MFKYIADVAVEIQKYNVEKYETLLRKIINTYGLTGVEIPGANLGKTYKWNDVDSWIKEGKYSNFFAALALARIDPIMSDLFAVIGTDNVKSVIKNPSYTCIATSDMKKKKMLDISNYAPAGTSYDKYLTTYLGVCKCDDKVRCVCGLGKGLFPYEYITSSNVLNDDQVPAKSAFDSKLRGSKISDEDYERVKWVWGYKKLLDFNADKLVFSIDKEESEIYGKMKANIAGGPSIIFNRYAKRNETKIRGGKICKKIIGYDANALYLWVLGNEMPCGRLTTIEAYDGIVDDIKNDKIFGFLECDIRTPEHLKQVFSEMSPIFKNVMIDCTDESVIGKHMFDYNQSRGSNRANPAR
ncbi:unnamed protein product [Phytophthora lilii]|uniref:Unnamed protein product n=1 Tax=Phytophthora lilii TaxID=2077276 RepID=A0A9W6WZ69_9STRA|nr:unnamed protein product [Phytophthora lilii]